MQCHFIVLKRNSSWLSYFSETPNTVAEKKFTDLQPLTSGSKPYHKLSVVHFLHDSAVHGYSLLRTQLNTEYFHDIFDESVRFKVPIEGHRKSSRYLLSDGHLTVPKTLKLAPGFMKPLWHMRRPFTWQTTLYCSSFWPRV